MTIKNDSRSRWLITPEKRHGCFAKLFCFPHAGAGASVFAGWARRVRPQIEVNAVQLPGREGRIAEPPLSCLDEIVSLATDAIEYAGPALPILYGHSFGAIVAFCVAKRLEARGHTVLRLVASAAPAPNRPRLSSPIHKLPDAEFIAALVSRYGGIPDVVLRDPELMQMFLPVLRADLRVLETYAIASMSPLACPITALAGSADPGAPPAAMEHWRQLSGHGFHIQALQGGHFFVRDHQATVLKIIDGALPTEASGQVQLT